MDLPWRMASSRPSAAWAQTGSANMPARKIERGVCRRRAMNGSWQNMEAPEEGDDQEEQLSCHVWPLRQDIEFAGRLRPAPGYTSSGAMHARGSCPQSTQMVEPRAWLASGRTAGWPVARSGRP